MGKNDGKGSKTGSGDAKSARDEYLEELLIFSEDLIFYGTILSTISSVMGLIGVYIARDVSRQKDLSPEMEEEAEEAATFFSAGATISGGSVIRGNINNEQEYAAQLYAQMNQMRQELNRVNGQIERIQYQLNQRSHPPH